MASLLSGGGNPFFGLEMLNQTLDQNQAWKEQQRRNALEEAYTAAQRERQAQEQGREDQKRNALAGLASGGRMPTPEEVGQTYMQYGDVEKGLSYMQAQQPKLAIKRILGPDNTERDVLFDMNTGSEVQELGAGIRQNPYVDFGYGAKKNLATGQVERVPVAPTVANGQRDPVKKPMPTSALKMQQDAVDALATSENTKTDIGAIRGMVEQGAIKLGPARNLGSQALNYAGISTEQSRNYATFRASLEKLRNDSLRLNKGVQTDGDAQRAWNELLANINDEGVVKQRLAEIEAINERGAQLQQMNIENIRDNYGLGELDTTAQRTPAAAVGPNRGLKPGTIEGGYRYMGGDPANQQSWKKVQ